MSREAANFRTYWKGTAFCSILEPIVYLLAFGVGLGATLIDGVDGLSYAEFVATGMVATAVIFSSALPAMFGTFVKERFQNTYDAILAAPVDVEELVTAEMLWIGLRAGFFGCFPLLVGSRSASTPTLAMLLVPIFAFVTALGFAAFGISVAASVSKIDQFNYVTTLIITPLFLVAGTFFPIDQLPEGLQIAANFNPLYQLVELVRGAAFGFEAVDILRFARPARLLVRPLADRREPHDQAPDRLTSHGPTHAAFLRAVNLGARPARPRRRSLSSASRAWASTTSPRFEQSGNVVFSGTGRRGEAAEGRSSGAWRRPWASRCRCSCAPPSSSPRSPMQNPFPPKQVAGLQGQAPGRAAAQEARRLPPSSGSRTWRPRTIGSS